MKSFLLLAAILLSFNAHANVDQNSTWSEIQDAYATVVIEGPTVAFSARSISYLNTCLEGNNVRTLNKVKIWRMVDRGDRTIFEVIGKDYLRTSTHYVSTWEDCRGRNDRCTTHSEEKNYSDTVSIKVRAQARGDRSFGPVLFTKDFTIPACM